MLYRILQDEVSKLEGMSRQGLVNKIADSEEYKTVLERTFRGINGAMGDLLVWSMFISVCGVAYPSHLVRHCLEH